jgi:hypothetical protein
MRPTFLVLAGALAVGCSNKDAERFLDALKRGDYETAHQNLHPKARADVPNAEALKTKLGGLELVDYGWTCATGGSITRTGYNVTVRGRIRRPVVIGTPSQGKCKAPLKIDTEKDTDGVWRVSAFEY